MAGIHPRHKRDGALVGRKARLHQIVLGVLQNLDAVVRVELEQADSQQLLRRDEVDQYLLTVLRPVGYDRSAVFAKNFGGAPAGGQKKVLIATDALLGKGDP